MRRIAAKRGGKCLSKKYINAKTKLSWQCREGHQWHALPDSVKHGHWCFQCSYVDRASKHRDSMESIQQLATRYGGKCLSNKHINSKTRLIWQCRKGHQWVAGLSNVKRGHWCPTCAGNKPLTIGEMHELATKRGGKCLSSLYSGVFSVLRWECADGHQWKATPDSIKQGHWCPECGLRTINENICREIFQSIFKVSFIKIRPRWLTNKRNNVMELDGYSKKLSLAFEYHGKQHFQKMFFYRGKGKRELAQRMSDDTSKRNICTKMGVKLIEIPFTVPTLEFYEYIIDQCHRMRIDIPRHKKINVKELISTYRLENLRKLKKLADTKGGKLLSDIYLGSVVNHGWQCAVGHIWEARPSSIEIGSWCPVCAAIDRGYKSRDNIENMQQIANLRGGKCISHTYVNAKSKIRWECSQGHQWEALPSMIKRGHWCPVCAVQKRKQNHTSKWSKE